MTNHRARAALGAAAAGLALLGGVAWAQTSPAPAPLTAFYSGCLASGGSPGVFDVAGSDTRTLLAASGQARLVSLTLMPGSENAQVTLTRKDGGATSTIQLASGQSAAFTAVEVVAKHNFKRVEYCLRVN